MMNVSGQTEVLKCSKAALTLESEAAGAEATSQ